MANCQYCGKETGNKHVQHEAMCGKNPNRMGRKKGTPNVKYIEPSHSNDKTDTSAVRQPVTSPDPKVQTKDRDPVVSELEEDKEEPEEEKKETSTPIVILIVVIAALIFAAMFIRDAIFHMRERVA